MAINDLNSLVQSGVTDTDSDKVADYLKSSRQQQVEAATLVPKEIQSLSPTAIIELFELDMSQFNENNYFFHAGTNGLSQAIVWQGRKYEALPIEASGFEVTTQGTLPRPKLTLANIQGTFSALVHKYDDLVGCKIIRRRTFRRFLDAVNFADGNSEADTAQHFPDDLWYIEQKSSENKYQIEWELASAMDLESVQLPRRQVIQNNCVWVYRGSECGYTGKKYFDANDVSLGTGDQAEANDFCGKRLSSCKCRFGESAVLPFGGFPGATRYSAS